MRLSTAGNVIDASILLTFLAYVFMQYAHNLDGTWNDRKYLDEPDEVIFYRNYRTTGAREDLVLITGCVMLWVKCFHAFRLLPYIGEMLGVLGAMTKKTLLFILLFCIELLFFSLCANIIYHSSSLFRYLEDSLLFLIPAAIGNFDFAEVE